MNKLPIFLLIGAWAIFLPDVPTAPPDDRVKILERRIEELELKLLMMESENRTRDDRQNINERADRNRDSSLEYLLRSNIDNIQRIKNLEIYNKH